MLLASAGSKKSTFRLCVDLITDSELRLASMIALVRHVTTSVSVALNWF